MVGWGALLGRILLPGCAADSGLRAAWGLALSVTLGGVLNLARLISPAVLLTYLGAGLLLFGIIVLPGWVTAASSRLRAIRRASPLTIAGFGVIALLLIVRYAASVHTDRYGLPAPYSFNKLDDFHAYLVFPFKMVEAGALGADPFSHRRLVTSLGGQYFLDALVAGVFSAEQLLLFDNGIGTLVVVALLIGFFQTKRLPPPLAWLVLLVYLVYPPETVNLTSVTTGVALFLALARTLGVSLGGRRVMLIALLTAATSALKSNLIPACAITVFAYYALESVRLKRFSGVRELTATAVLTTVLLLPWMLALYRSSGTLLYPVFGHGVETVATVSWIPAVGIRDVGAILLALPGQGILPLAAAGILAFVAMRRVRTLDGPFLALLFGAVGGAVVLALVLGRAGYAVDRFVFPFGFAAFLGWLVTALAPAPSVPAAPGIQRGYGLVAIAISLILVGRRLPDTTHLYANALHSIKAGLQRSPLIAPEMARRYAAMQLAVPAHEPLLARLAFPFLLDFSRNPVYVVDWPAFAGPSPMPVEAGTGQRLRESLRAHGIRYLAYSYADQAGFGRLEFEHLRRAAAAPSDAVMALYSQRFQERLGELGETSPRVYDDGEIFVLDLAAQKAERRGF